MRMRNCAATFVLFTAAAIAGDGAPKRQAVRQVDRILIESSDPRQLYDLFTGPLEFPVAWPMSGDVSFSSGGFGTGNLNIEVFGTAPKGGAKPARPSARFAGIAFEPYSPVAEVLPELQARGVSYSAPEPYVSTLPDKTRGTVWTTVVLDGLALGHLRVFLFQYSPAFLKVQVRRNQLAGQLALRRGGPLGIVSVAEIVIGTPDMQADILRWQRLLPAAASRGLWRVGKGPALRMVADTRPRIRDLVFEVASLARARAFLSQKGMLGPAAFQGLGIQLKESPRPAGLRSR